VPVAPETMSCVSGRFYWYKSWFMPNTAAYHHVLHVFPHWNWGPRSERQCASVGVFKRQRKLNYSCTAQARYECRQPPRCERCSCEKARFSSFFQGRVVDPPLAHSAMDSAIRTRCSPLASAIPHSSKIKNGTLFSF